MRSASLALILMVASITAEERVVENHTIIVMESPAQMVAQPVAYAAQRPVAYASQSPAVYKSPMERIWTHPDQVFVDSDYGPMPLFTELTASGDLYIPPGIVREFAADTTPAKAALYLEQRRVAARRYLQMSQVMQEVAAQRGDVVPKDFTPPGNPMSGARNLVRPGNATDDSIGVPAIGPQQAMVSGLKKEDVPVIPGRTTARYVEVMYIWDHRCLYSVNGYKDFARVGAEANDRQLGPRFMTVSMDNDAMTVQAQLDWFDWRWQQDKEKVTTRAIENTVDMTNLRSKLKITRTPTYFFVDRRTGKMARLEGQQSADAIRKALMELVSHGDESWQDADPRWFRPVTPEPGSESTETKTDGGNSIRGSTPVKPQKQIQSWDPDNVSN